MLNSVSVAVTFVSMQMVAVIAIERNYFQAEQTLGNFSFRYYNTPKKFKDAQRNCSCKDGWLAEPRYQDIQSIVSSFTNESVWIGLSWNNGEWRWDNGDDVLFEHWETQINSSSNKCASISTKSEWMTSQCDAPLPFVCQHDTNFIGNQKLDIRQSEGQKVNFTTANENCKEGGWTGLVDVKTKALNDYIKSVNDKTQFFTGGKQSDTGEWAWSDDCPIEFTDWNVGEPDQSHEKCLAATKSGWIDVSSEVPWTRNYICRKKFTDEACPTKLCSNKGNCTRTESRYSCKCNRGYHGSSCEKELPDYSCAFESCSVNGNCTRKGKGYSCSCANGYYGVKCDKDYCELSPCRNSGRCSYIPTHPYYNCSCLPEFEGINCTDHRYTEAEGCKYYVNRQSILTFFDAKSKCNELNGTLAMIKTSEIQTVIEKQMELQYGLNSSGKTKEFWFGGQKIDGVWYWEDGTEMPLEGSNQKWQNKKREVAIISSYSSKELRDMGWYSKNKTNRAGGYACEKPSSDPCYVVKCFNDGICNSTGCQANCFCSYPYYGQNCENETLRIINSTIIRIEYSRVNISCVFRGYPNATVHWLLRSGISQYNISRFNDTIFGFHQSYEVGNTIGILEIKQRDFLGSAEIGCYAMNLIEKTNITFTSPNSDLMISRTTSYRRLHEKLNSSDAEKICISQGRTLLQILDNTTLKFISNKLNEIGYKQEAFIDLKRQKGGITSHWQLSNGTVIYYETNNSKTRSSPPVLNNNFVAWGSAEPSSTGDCAVLRPSKHSNLWHWATINCSTSANVLCQKPVDGSIERMDVVNRDCEPVVTVALLSQRSKSFVHRIEIFHINETIVKTLEQIPVKINGSITETIVLENGTSYVIKLTVCPTCPSPYELSKNVTTDMIVEANERNVSVIETSNTANGCKVDWEIVKMDGVVGFEIVAVEQLNKPIAGYAETMNVSMSFSRNARNHLFTMKPNRRYEVSAQTKTCKGLGEKIYAVDFCITDTAAPESIIAPTEIQSHNGEVLMRVFLPDESNGPISCILLLVVYNPLTNIKEIDYNILENATAISESTSLKQNDIYVALAIPRHTVADEVRSSGYFQRTLGDGTKPECKVADDSLSTRASRLRRDLTKDTKFLSQNRKLEENMRFKVFVVTITPGDSTIYIKSSEPLNFTTGPYEVIPQEFPVTATVGIAGGALAILILILIASVLLRKKNKTAMQNIPMGEVQTEEYIYENLAIDESTRETDTAIKMDNLLSKYNELSSSNNEKFLMEFEKLKEEAKNLNFPDSAATNEAVRKKNRYKNIIPADHARVALQSAECGYINASYIHGFEKAKKFIATQGPLKSTIEDFWIMVVQQKCSVIVMLTKCIETGKNKCEKYWPGTKNAASYGAITIQNVSEKNFGFYVVRTFHVRNDDQTMKVKQVHFLCWPDHGVPVTTSSIMNVHKFVENLKSEQPIIVHCSAGAGRTGAFIAYDLLKAEALATESIDVYSCVLNMRQNRHDMVQSALQYVLAHKMILENHLFGDTSIPKSQFKDKIQKRDLEKEFRDLSLIGPIEKLKVENKSKEAKESSSAPYRRNYVTIFMHEHETEKPFINASTIECNNPKIRIIATKTPSNSTTETFWRCILDNGTQNIVMLTSKGANPKKEASLAYWPEKKNQPLHFGDITIKLESSETNSKYAFRILIASRGGDELKINHYQYNGWSENQCPENPSDILELVQKLIDITGSTNTSLMVHCSDGVGRTGVFCALFNILTRLQYDDEIDIFRTVKNLRDCRSEMVKTLDQYKFCYSSVVAHLSYMDAYATMEVSVKKPEESIYENL